VSQLKSLKEIEGIWARRLERAEDELRRAQAGQVRAEQALQAAKEALADYLKRLPGLIEQLYADCIGHLVSRQFVQDKTHEEGQLRAKVADYKGRVTEAEKALQAAIEAVKEAQAALNRERVRLDVMRDLIKDERKRMAVAEARTLAKALDDLAGVKFVRALHKTT
jgi:DNA repair exonuclease SbcCD ATPase subunit